MKRLFRIDESEKNRILGMHKSASSRQYLKEQEASSEQPATDGEASSEQPSTDNDATEQVAFDCQKINEVLETPDVKKWVEKITGPARWTIRRGGEKLAEKDVYKGVIDVIKIMQCKLGLEPNGVFDNETDTKLKSLQSEKGLKPDGIVGPKTWGVMFVEEQESEEAPSTNECYMNFGEEGTMLPIYENEAKAARKAAGFSFYFFEDGTVIVWDENGPLDGTEEKSTYQWRCIGNDVKFFISTSLGSFELS